MRRIIIPLIALALLAPASVRTVHAAPIKVSIKTFKYEQTVKKASEVRNAALVTAMRSYAADLKIAIKRALMTDQADQALAIAAFKKTIESKIETMVPGAKKAPAGPKALVAPPVRFSASANGKWTPMAKGTPLYGDGQHPIVSVAPRLAGKYFWQHAQYRLGRAFAGSTAATTRLMLLVPNSQNFETGMHVAFVRAGWKRIEPKPVQLREDVAGLVPARYWIYQQTFQGTTEFKVFHKSQIVVFNPEKSQTADGSKQLMAEMAFPLPEGINSGFVKLYAIKFDRAMQAAINRRKIALVAAKKTYVADLTVAMKEAGKANDIDKALEIAALAKQGRAEIAVLLAKPPEALKATQIKFRNPGKWTPIKKGIVLQAWPVAKVPIELKGKLFWKKHPSRLNVSALADGNLSILVDATGGAHLKHLADTGWRQQTTFTLNMTIQSKPFSRKFAIYTRTFERGQNVAIPYVGAIAIVGASSTKTARR